MMQPDSKRPVTLEDILRLKRSERPPAEFWNQFDRELRAKQLAALVEKRPWWRTISFPKIVVGLRRHHMLLGATAVLAVTFFSVREYRGPKTAPASNAVTQTQVAATVAPVIAPAATKIKSMAVSVPQSRVLEATVSPTLGADDAAPSRIEPTVLEVAAPATVVAVAQPALSSEATLGGDITPLISMVGLPGSDDTMNASPSARLIADNLANLQGDDATLTNSLLGTAHPFETRVVARNKPVEPLAQMRVQSSARRSALITQATFVSTTAPVVTGDRAARSLSDERLYETISRVNARGAGMLVKF